MPSLDTPPNPPVKLRTGRFGELEEHELLHLLDTLDDEQARARFRESIYISIIICLAIAWFLFYGPRVLFHQPRLISPTDVLRDRDKQITFLDTPKNLPRTPAPKQHNTITDNDRKALQKMEAARKAGSPAPPAPQPQAQPTPQPPAQQQAAQQPQQATPPAPLPQHPPQQQALADAPRPAPARPNFNTQNQSAGDMVRQAAEQAARAHGQGGDLGTANSPSRGGAATGVQVLSDTMGVDFNPYLRRILSDIKRNWLPLIPEEARPPLNKQGETLVRFTILPDGRIGAMHLDGSSQDTAIDRAAWGGITSVGQFPPLPNAFKGPNLELRIDFLVNKNPPE